MSEGGVVAVSTFAPGTFRELSDVLGVSLSYRPPETFRALFEPFCEVLHWEVYETSLSFGDPMEVLRHLRHTGVTGVSNGFRWSRARLESFSRDYLARFPEATLTYRPVLLVGRKKEKMQR